MRKEAWKVYWFAKNLNAIIEIEKYEHMVI